MRDILVDALGTGEDGISLTGRGSRKKIKGIRDEVGNIMKKLKKKLLESSQLLVLE